MFSVILIRMIESTDKHTPFPAMTSAQRLYLDINGYVLIENMLSVEQIKRCTEGIYAVRQQFLAAQDPLKYRAGGCYVEDLTRCDEYYVNLGRVIESGEERLIDYFVHPRIVSIVEEAMGGKIRIDEANLIVNSRDPNIDLAKYRHQFHRGGQPGFDSYVYDDLYHSTFIKTLTNLTDIGPDDGGTCMIAGSHKLNCNEDDMVIAAYEEPSLIHQIEAPAGSTLIMYETTIHATGQIRSNNDRVMIIGGYSPPKHQSMGGQWSDACVQMFPESQRELLLGRPYWTWPERHRTLGMEPGRQDVPYKARMWSVTH